MYKIITYNFFLWTHLNKLYEAMTFTVYIDIFILIKDSILIGLTFNHKIYFIKGGVSHAHL